jgi:four helix bundle protein
MAVQSYWQLIAWQKAMELVKRIYETTKDFPKGVNLRFDKSNQTSGGFRSVEHCRRTGTRFDKGILHHLSIAYGSLMETETQILIAESLNYVETEESNLILEKTAETGSLINGLSRSLKQKL